MVCLIAVQALICCRHAPLLGKARDGFLVFDRPVIGQAEIDEVIDSLLSEWIVTRPKVSRFEGAVHENRSSAKDNYGIGGDDLPVIGDMVPLSERYAPSNERLFELFGRSSKGWESH